MTWWWPWLLSVAGATSLFIAGSHPRSGWLMGLLLQPVWATYAIVSQQWGFLASTALFTLVNARNWMRSRPSCRAVRADAAS